MATSTPPLSLEQRVLVSDTLWLAKHLATKAARRFGGKRLPKHRYEDVYQQACLGLVVAAARFRKERGVKFATYAWYWVRVYADRAVRGEPTPVGDGVDSTWVSPAAEAAVLAREVVGELVRLRSEPIVGGRHRQRVYRAEHPERDVAMYLRVRALDESLSQVAAESGVTRQRAEQICNRVGELVERMRREAA